ncbi:MAG: 16S rRNA (guanine(527)-N(7))-methyltransferase RsmG [Brevinematales bacterium]|nr:16S rRNA (guanine(527)-N(7))-methyltransferase RsmG [Brevinematales bacterium]
MMSNLSPDQQNKLVLYQQEILHWNTTTNLIGRSTASSFEREHLLNSLEILPYLEGNLPLIDIGTGGGLPGIPLAIALPQREIFLTEIDKKKLAFLQYITAKLKLSNTHVVNILPSTLFDMPCDIVSRAYGPISRVLSWTHQHAPHAKHYYLLKGTSVTEELAQANLLDACVYPLSKGYLVTWKVQE